MHIAIIGPGCAAVAVPQKRMGPVQMSTIMNVGWGAMMEAKRDATGKLAKMVLKGEET